MGETPSPSIPIERLPLGFRFHPTDEELINLYLKRKINGRIRPTDAAVIPVIDVCRFEPWDLPAKSVIRSDDPEWFFFAPVDRKHPNGGRSNRATEAGYWKATGKDRLIRSRPRGGPAVLVGMKKTLVFHRGRAPRGTRTIWIMHEYRTVEPEFDCGGDQGGFVLCRLFRKPEETIAGLISYETEVNDSAPTLTRPPGSTLQRTLEEEFATKQKQESPSSTLQKTDGLEEELTTPLNQESLGSDQQEKLQSLPDTITKQSADSSLVVEAHYLTPYPVKPEDSHCNSSMTSDAGDQEAEIKEGAPLFDDLAQFLGPECKHLLSDDFSQSKSPMLSSDDYAVCYDVDQTLVHYQMSEQDSVTELLDAMLSTPEEYSADVSNYQTESATRAFPEGQISMINHGSDWNSAMNTNSITSNDVGPEVLMAQGGPSLEVSSQSRLPFSSHNSLQMDTWNRYNEMQPSLAFVPCNSKEKSTSKLEPMEARLHYMCSEDLVGPANSNGTDINIRSRSAVNSNTFNYPGPQGIAGRRVRLQSPKRVNHACKPVSNVNMLSLVSTGTTEADKHAKNQDAEKMDISEPVVTDHEQSSSDDDVAASPEFVFHQSAKERTDQTLRSRTRQTNDADVKLESPSLQQEVPSVTSLPIRRIGVAVLMIASLLCAGTIWFLNS